MAGTALLCTAGGTGAGISTCTAWTSEKLDLRQSTIQDALGDISSLPLKNNAYF